MPNECGSWLSADVTNRPCLGHVVAEVAESYRAGKLLVFAGAGVSEAAGLPSRTDLIRRLSELASNLDLDKQRVDEINALVQREQWSDAFAELRDGLGRNEFGYWFERCLDDSGAEVPAIARSIADMAPGLRAVLTTNMDCVLDRAFGGTWASFAGVTRDIPQRQHYILKLRGMLSDRATWIVTRDDYDRAFYDAQRRDVLTSLYHTYQILFVCHDFSDRDIEQIIDRVGASDSPQPPRHVALVPAGVAVHRRKTTLTAAGIRVVELGGLDDGAAEIVNFLSAVTEEVREHNGRSRAGRPAILHSGLVTRPKALPAMVGCPFPGLEAFNEDNAALFFGREAEISAALQLLGDTQAGHKRWLFIDGASGVGKSSLVLAGILPKVRHNHIVGTYEEWLSVDMRPGVEPVWNLAHVVCRALQPYLPSGTTLDDLIAAFDRSETALAAYLRQYTPPGHGFLLVIDQFEEAFTLASDGERRAFDALLGCALSDKGGPLYLATTIRADFVAHMAECPLLESLLNREASRFYLKAMSMPGLRAAIVEPARRTGLVWDEHLVDRILRDAADSEGSLPLVAHVLQALWLEREGDRLTHAAYERLGGVAGSLTRSADTILSGLATDEREQARALLLCLVAVGPRDSYTRRPVSRAKALRAAGGGQRAEHILARLSGGRDPGKPSSAGRPCARLLAVTQHEAQHRVDLVHEALLQQWATLAAWIEESRKELLLHDDLKARLDSWKRSGSSPRNLPSGAELEYLLAARQLADDDEREFLDCARWKQARARRWLRALVVFLIAGVLGVSWLAAYAFSQRDEARRQTDKLRTTGLELLSAEKQVSAAKGEVQRLEAKTVATQTELEQRLRDLARARADAQKADRERLRANKLWADARRAKGNAREALARARAAQEEAEQRRAQALAAEDRALAAIARKEKALAKLAALVQQKRDARARLEELAGTMERTLKDLDAPPTRKERE